jgi:acyl-coenzyme A synthetase/AMP-(fatty) acid ligase
VSEAVVVGVPHPDLGEDVLAIVVGGGALNVEGLREQMRSKVASFAVPGQWRLRTQPLPVNLTGKVDKPALLAELRGEREAAPANAAP